MFFVFIEIIKLFTGFIDERTLVERLNAGMNQGRGQLNRVRYEQRRRFQFFINIFFTISHYFLLSFFRAEETLLREEQDREFREALELDRRAQELKQRVSYNNY